MNLLLKNQLFRISIWSLVLVIVGYQFIQQRPQQASAHYQVHSGNLLITYLGVPIGGDPIFQVHNMLPGDCVTRTVQVKNNGTNPANITVRSDNEIDDDGLSTQLDLTISENATDLYGGTNGTKTVNDFFTDSNPDGLPLSTVTGNGGTTSYDFQVCFKTTAGNEYQLTQTIFDLIFKQTKPPVQLPEVCSDLQGIVTEVITGTPGHDKLEGTPANELIIGLAGNDKIHGGGGHDCIIGGDGKDKLYGQSGNDIIDGGEGKDKIDAGSGNDLIFGGAEQDNIDSGSGEDTIYAGPGNDKVNAGSQDDLVYGGTGKDQIKGGSGNDQLYGEDDDDKLQGGSGNDYLDGGPDQDRLHGDSGTDTCVAGENLHSCEL